METGLFGFTHYLQAPPAPASPPFLSLPQTVLEAPNALLEIHCVLSVTFLGLLTSLPEMP
jgi:hypothetical protein